MNFRKFSFIFPCKTRNFQNFLLGATETIETWNKRHFQGFFSNFMIHFFIFDYLIFFKFLAIFLYFGALWHHFDKPTVANWFFYWIPWTILRRYDIFWIFLELEISDFLSKNPLPMEWKALCTHYVTKRLHSLKISISTK